MLNGPGMRSRAAEMKPSHLRATWREATPEAARFREKALAGVPGSQKPGRDGDRLFERVIATSHSRREAIATSIFPLQVE